MTKNRRKAHNCLVLLLLALIINMSVNVHDSILLNANSSDENEVESLIELLMLSINNQWELSDAPDGVGEDQIASTFSPLKYTCSGINDLLSYFPDYKILNFPDLSNRYIGINISPIPPPPIDTAFQC